MQMKIPLGGRIRPGSKRLANKAKENPEVRRVYNECRQAKKSFAEISVEIRRQVPTFTDEPMVPCNPPYFRVERADFPNPKTAVHIMKQYGEPDRNGEKLFDGGPVEHRLYRFPVMFFAEKEQVMASELQCWSASDLQYWSEIGQDSIRRCMQYAPPCKPDGAHRVVRLYGGRATIPRTDTNGVCQPEMCAEYQSRKCSERWRFLFYMPDIDGLRVMSLDSDGFYGMDDAMSVLTQVQMVRDTITGLKEDGSPIFWFSKKQKRVKMLNPTTGVPEHKNQWVITLDADLDVTRLFRERAQTLPRAAQAAALLSGSTVPAETDE